MTNCRLILAAIVLMTAAALSSCDGVQSESSIQSRDQLPDVTTAGQGWHYLWDPGSTSLEDWQALRGVRDMILGPRSTLLVADSDNGRIAWISRNGRLLESIGRRGDGPGEFQGPYDLALDAASSVLWVTDRLNNSVSRFQLQSDDVRFRDRFRISERLRFSGGSGSVVENSASVWLVPGSQIGEERIRLYDSSGNKVREFGDPWEPEEVTQRPGLSTIYNATELRALDENRLLAVLTTRLVLEIWQRDGQLLDSAEIELPEFSWIRSQDYPDGAIVTFIQGVATSATGESVFILTRDEEHLVLRELLAASMKLGASYRWEVDEPTQFRHPVVIEDDAGLNLYAVDIVNGAVVEFSGTSGN